MSNAGNNNANVMRKQLSDIGQYPLYSTVIVAAGQAVDLRMFSYKLGEQVPGAVGAVPATEQETNLEVGGQIGSGSMRIESIGLSWWGFSPAAATGVAAYYPTLADIERFDAHSMFRFECNGKVFQHGRFTMFPAGHGIYGFSGVNNAETLSNGVPTFQARTLLRDPIDLGPSDTFVGILRFPRGAITPNLGGALVVTSWLFGPRSRPVV
jgi:hypothetical protein